MQMLQFIDRSALNYANLFNYGKALNLKGTQFNYLSASKQKRAACLVLVHKLGKESDMMTLRQWSTLATSLVNIPPLF